MQLLLLGILLLNGIDAGENPFPRGGFNDLVRNYETLNVQPHQYELVNDKHINARVSFTAHGRDFNLVLRTHKNLFSPNFKLRSHDEDGHVTTHELNTRHYVTGHLEDEHGTSIVHGKVTDDHFQGIIHTMNESFHLERLDKHLPPGSVPSDHNVIIYKASDINHELTNQMTCGVDNTNIHKLQEQGGYFNFRRKQSSAGGYLRKKRIVEDGAQVAADENFDTCDIHVWADYNFFSNVGNSDEAITLDEMVIHIQSADTIYRRTEFTGQSTGYGVAIANADIIKSESGSGNPLSGTFTVEELLEAFSAFDFNSVCLGHLFTYTDFSGTLGLAYVADPDGSLSGGICEKRSQTYRGELNLNTGLTSLITFGRKLPRAVSTITTTHEIGHNFGSIHDPSSTSECSPGGSQGNYIMYPTATDGNLPNNRDFSSCSKDQIGKTIGNNGNCFVPKPTGEECGNGVIEGDEECDCKYNDTAACHSIDPCCLPGECKLIQDADCSPNKYRCCNSSCMAIPDGEECAIGDECLLPATCKNFTCPLPELKNETCNGGNNVCEDGVCSGSICSKYNAETCFCTEDDKLCDVCCVYSNGSCLSTFSWPDPLNASIQSGFPCKDFTGYCDNRGVCVFVDTNRELNNLKDIIPSFESIVEWLKGNWYWVLVGVAVTVILIILLQVTYRRKNNKNKNKPSSRNREERQALTRGDEQDATRL